MIPKMKQGRLRVITLQGTIEKSNSFIVSLLFGAPISFATTVSTSIVPLDSGSATVLGLNSVLSNTSSGIQICCFSSGDRLFNPVSFLRSKKFNLYKLSHIGCWMGLDKRFQYPLLMTLTLSTCDNTHTHVFKLPPSTE